MESNANNMMMTMVSKKKFIKIENQSIVDGDMDTSSSSDESYDIGIKNESSDEDFVPRVRTQQQRNTNVLKRLNTLNENPMRQPTRRPDPNTFNRNALMARENRRRKKEYVETLEKKINECEVENQQLRKMFKKQCRFVQKLKDERRYYQNIFSNKTEILAILKAVQKANLPFVHPILNETPDTSPVPVYTFPCIPQNDPNQNNKSIYGQQDDGTAENEDPILSSTIFDQNYFFTDYTIPFDTHDSWENLLGCNSSPFSEEYYDTTNADKRTSPNILLQDIQSNICGEHNYVNRTTKTNQIQDTDTGVCIHVSNGKISLEFCPTCHYQAASDSGIPKNDLLDE